ncbi:PAS domain-containing protein [Hydrogenophaga pseudoflava]|uniref:PAS domain-containing protein n=1 Tax=Hydrogenophaga pseudoflava TaxID=47421 RepID=UPI0027E59252|nr:PAS domain-containing protein [Hydrogenophaga pseudoflava]MDQ7746661.1 PAS domain-containing protein [Hydrogenophaga pseudoflava]
MSTHRLHRIGPRVALPLLPGLATVVLLALVLVANHLIIEHELEQRAGYRVAQVSRVFAELVSRTVSRRVSELQLTGRLLQQGNPSQPTGSSDELDHLRGQSTAYVWIGWVDPQGRLLVSSPAEPARTGQVLLDPARAQAGSAELLTVGVLPSWASLPTASALGVLVVPLRTAQNAPAGALVALLDQRYFEALRQFALGDPVARRSLELALLAPQDSVALGAVAAPGLQAVEGLTALAGVDSDVKVPWRALAHQPLQAAVQPATQLESGLLGWGLPAALLIGGLGVWISRRLARPYQQVFDAVSTARPRQDGGEPGAFLRAVADAMRRLAPAWDIDQGSQALLEHLLQDAQRLHQVLDQLPTPVYLLDTGGRVSFWNQQAAAVFGWSPEEALGRPIDELLPGRVHDDAEPSADDQLRAFEARTVTRSGLERWGEWRLLPLRSPEGESLGQIVLVRDITERVHAATAAAQHQDDLAELTHRLMQQEQATTRRLAQTLHDQLGQTLGAVRLAFDTLQPVLGAASDQRHRDRAQRLGLLIDQAVAQVRQALVELRPPLLEDLGLAAALDNEVQMRRNEAAPAELRLDTEPLAALTRWPADVEHAAFMVAREAIANAVRHAHARQIRLVLKGAPDHLVLSIEDDGEGMPEDRPGARPGHLGLVGMRERALAIGARMRVGPAQPHGLCVTLQWPANTQPPVPTDTP